MPLQIIIKPRGGRRRTNVRYQPEHTKSDYQTILDNLNQAIKDAGLTKKTFAARAGMPYVMCTERLAGKKRIFAEELIAFAQVLGLPPKALYVGTSAVEPDLAAVSVAAKVRAYMGLRNITGTKLAQHLQMSKESLLLRLREGMSFNVHELLEIAEALNVPAHWFLEDTNNLKTNSTPATRC